MNLCLFEDDAVDHLRPLVDTRPVWDLRLALRSPRDTAVDAFQPDRIFLHCRSLVRAPADHRSRPDLVTRVPEGDVLFVNGRFVAAEGEAVATIRRAVAEGAPPTTFVDGDTVLAAWIPDARTHLPADLLEGDAVPADAFATSRSVDLSVQTDAPLRRIDRPADLIDLLPDALTRDVAARRGRYNILEDIYSRRDADVHESVIGVRSEDIVLEEGVTVRPGAILNASEGPIFVDRNATIAEQAVVRGPCYIGEQSQVKVGANVHTSAFGTYCKIGGEVHDSIVHSFSNKSHAGFLGHSYLGRWCNLGADTNTSNLKNNYGEISLYDAADRDFAGTGRQFMGLVMGDHSKCGINTMFNTGTVIGTCCNVYGGGFPPRYLPPFSWGSPEQGFTTYRLDKALEVAEHVLGRRDRAFTDAHRQNLTDLFEQTREEREELLGGG